MNTQHSAACYDCSYQSAWTDDRASADDDRIAHQDIQPMHKIVVISRAR